MRISEFPDCCGAKILHAFNDYGNVKHAADDFEVDFHEMDRQNKDNNGSAFDLVILTEYQYGGAKAGLTKRGFKEVGPRVRNNNSGNYLVLLQRVNGHLKAPAKPKTVKKSAFKTSKRSRL